MLSVKQALLETALRRLAEVEKADAKKNGAEAEDSAVFSGRKVKKAYPAYVAALGPALRQAGLLPTLAAYSSIKPGEAQAAKRPLLDLLKGMLTDSWPDFNALAHAPENTGKTLFDFASENLVEHAQLRRRLEAATVALKLALRTYQIEE